MARTFKKISDDKVEITDSNKIVVSKVQLEAEIKTLKDKLAIWEEALTHFKE